MGLPKQSSSVGFPKISRSEAAGDLHTPQESLEITRDNDAGSEGTSSAL
jgi:hypothetical protein